MPSAPHSAYFLVGPTAAGKTAVAQLLAAERGADILSADSMLVYRGMDLGTAKPTVAERAGVRYAGIDLVGPDEWFDVAAYAAHAAAALSRARAAGRPVIVTGGTGLYVQSLLAGVASRPPADPAWRTEAEQLLAAHGLGALQDRLRQLDADRFRALTASDRQNPRRLMRAVELARATDGGHAPSRPLAAASSNTPQLVGLRLPPALLWERIQARIQTMYAQGLLDEVRRLRAAFPTWSATARQAIGYAEALEALDGRCTIPEAQQRTALRTRQLAKRQMTWFRHQVRVRWVEVAPGATVADVAARVRELWNADGPTPVYY